MLLDFIDGTYGYGYGYEFTPFFCIYTFGWSLDGFIGIFMYHVAKIAIISLFSP